MRFRKGEADIWSIIFIGLLIWGLYSYFHKEKGSSTYSDNKSDNAGELFGGDKKIDRDEAIDSHWDEIKENLNGSETINACYSSVHCYDLDADISGGSVESIYFPNGGYLYFDADIDENGYASDFDKEGREWDFSIDMDSSMVDEAIDAWASSNNYEIR